MTLILIITTAIIALVITGFIMELHRLQNEVERNYNAWEGSNAIREILENKLASAGKNYIKLKNEKNIKDNREKKVRQIVVKPCKRKRVV